MSCSPRVVLMAENQHGTLLVIPPNRRFLVKPNSIRANTRWSSPSNAFITEQFRNRDAKRQRQPTAFSFTAVITSWFRLRGGEGDHYTPKGSRKELICSLPPAAVR